MKDGQEKWRNGESAEWRQTGRMMEPQPPLGQRQLDTEIPVIPYMEASMP